MSVNVGTAVGYLELDTSKFKSGFETAKKQLQGFTDSTKSVGDRFISLGNGLKTIGSNMSKYITVPLLGAGAIATKTAIDFESAFAGVKKTVDATDKELSKLEEGIRGLAKEMPTAATEIAGVAEAAGQLGIEVPNIMNFTKTMVMLGDSTNMSAEEAATSLARLANITGMPQTQFDKLGSTIVALGNNLATTESEITEMGLRLAGAGAQVGMSEAQILSFAGALSSVGINAEAGGSAFSKVMINMQLATETGGEKLKQFASVAGMSASEFSKAFKEDATSAIIAFIKGLGDAESQGKSAIGILDEMDIKEVVLRDTLLRASGASDVFSKSIEIGTNAWEENVALTNEAEQRYATMQSKMSILKNKFTDIGITVGTVLMPKLEKLVDWLGKVADWFSKLDESTQNTIIVMASIVAAIGPVLIIIGQMSLGISALIKGFTLFTSFMKTQLIAILISFNTFLHATLIPTLTATAFSIGAVTIPVWAVIAAIAALIAIGVLLYKNWDTVKAKCIEVWSSVSEFLTTTWESLKENVSNIWDSITSFISEAWESIKTTTSDIWNGIKDVLSTVWEAIKSVIELPIQFISDLIRITWDFISSTTSTIWNSIMNILKSVWDLISAVVKLGIAVVQLVVTVAWNAIKDATTNVWNAIKNTVSTVWNFISNLASTIWNGVKNTITNVWNAIKPTVETSVNFIKDVINTVFTAIKTFISTIVEAWKSIITTAWDAIKSKVSTVVEAIKTVITTVFNAIKSVITTVVEGWKNIISTAWDNIKTTVSNGADLVKSTIEKVFNTLETILTAPFKAAEKVISGILGGITETVNKVTNAVNSVKNSSKNIEAKSISPTYKILDSITEEQPYSLIQNIEDAKRLVYSDKQAKASIIEGINNVTSSTKGIKGNSSSDKGYSSKNITINNTYNSPKPASIYELKKQDEITMRRLAMRL